MNATSVDAITKLLDSAGKLLGTIAWPLVAIYILRRFERQFRDFLSNLAEFTIKGAGFEASGKSKSNAVASLVAASAARSGSADSPSVSAQNARAAAETVAQVATPRAIRSAKRSTVLWVDDKPDNNINERQALEAFDVRFVLAKTTEDALGQIGRQQFDLIISDMERPGDPQAGYTLLDEIRTTGNQTPYVIYAGSRSTELTREAQQRGAIGSTSSPNELFEMVLTSLGKR